MPVALIWLAGAFGLGAASGLAISDTTKKVVLYGGLGFVAYKVMTND